MQSREEVTEILQKINNGSDTAPEELLPLVYDELRKLAATYMEKERPDHTLQATALVHDAYIRLVDWENVSWQNRAHFFSVAAKVMRNVLVDHAVKRKSKKRDFGQRIELTEAISQSGRREVDIAALSANCFQGRESGHVNFAEVLNFDTHCWADQLVGTCDYDEMQRFIKTDMHQLAGGFLSASTSFIDGVTRKMMIRKTRRARPQSSVART